MAVTKELPKLVLNRSLVLRTTTGHAIQFIKGRPTYVPRAAYSDALAIGAAPVDGEEVDLSKPEAANAAPADAAERNKLIMDAIELLIARNEREDFTAAGVPNIRAVGKEVGFNVSAREIAAMMQEYHNKKAAAVE
jgi:hypothetical protein